MESLYILVPLSVLLVFIIGAIFWWCLRSGQYDDLEGPAYRLLMDDRDAAAPRRQAEEDSSGPSAGRAHDEPPK